MESRPGYFRRQFPFVSPTRVQQRIDSAVLSDTSIQDVPATVRILPTAQTNGGYKVDIVVDVVVDKMPDVSGLPRRMESICSN